MNEAYNTDCLEAMRAMPDNAFDLAVVDPPYGDGCSQNGNVEREKERRTQYNRFGGWFDRYKTNRPPAPELPPNGAGTPHAGGGYC